MYPLSAALPLLTLLAMASTLRSGLGAGVRHALLCAAAMTAVLMVAICEGLSAFQALVFGYLCMAWAAALIAALAARVALGKRREDVRGLPGPLWPRDGADGLLLLIVVLIVSLIAFTALISAPDNWDSLTYHLARIVHWIQNRGLQHYPTSIDRQLYQPPGSEMALVTLQLLWGNDRLANLMQWASLVGSLLAVHAVAELLGAGRRGQVLAVFVCGTLPMAILQGSSTQNDLAVSFWLISLVYFVLRFRASPRGSGALLVGACVGLAVLTKGTAYLFATPFMAWFCLIALAKLPKRFALSMVAAALAIAALLNGATWARNYETFGSPLGPTLAATAPHSYANAAMSPRIVASNALRNAAIQLGLVRQYDWNSLVKDTIVGAHRWLGISPNDPRTTWTGTEFDVIGSYHEDVAGNPLHFLLACATIAVIAIRPPARHRGARGVAAGVLLGFLLFCTYLKWQPWHGRLHLPLFVLLAPLTGIALEKLATLRNGPRTVLACCTALGVMALPALLINQGRPLLGPKSVLVVDRTAQYFHSQPALSPIYAAAAERIKNLHCQRLALAMGEDDWEYPLWVLLDAQNGGGPKIEHVASIAPAAEPVLSSLPYCALFSTLADAPAVYDLGQKQFLPVWRKAPVQLYEPAP